MQIAVSETWSKPFGDPRMLSKCFTWESSTNKKTMVGKPKNDSGQVLLEKLPMELLGKWYYYFSVRRS
jgi:hypothetical protein